MKPLRVFNIVCKGKPYPQIGDTLVLRDGAEEGYDFKRADWGTDFSREFDEIQETREWLPAFQESFYPHALVVTNEKMIVKAIIPITQHLSMKNEVQNDK